MFSNQYKYVSPLVNINATATTSHGTVTAINYLNAVFKKTEQGIWFMDFNLFVICSSTARITITVTMVGVMTNGMSIFPTLLSGLFDYSRGYTENATLVINHPALTTTSYTATGSNILLLSKPTAYLPEEV